MTTAAELKRENEQRWNAVARWSRAERMSDLEALMWRAERHPQLSSTIVALEILDRAPDWERLHEAHAWGADLVPRFRQRVIEPAVAVGPPAWAPDPAFDLDYHLRRAVLPPPRGHAQLLEVVQAFAQTPLDRSRPLWEALLVEGLAEGRAAYVLKSHHSLSDGIGGIQLIGGIHSRTRRPTRHMVDIDNADGAVAPRSPVGLALEELGDAVRAAPSAARWLLAPLGHLVTHPRSAAATGHRFLGSIRRVASAPGTPSPLLRPRTGRRWRFRTVERPVEALKAAGRAGGGSLNDAYLAALVGGLARYHERHGAPVPDLPIAVPVSLRRAGEPQGGNRFTAVQIAGPAQVRDPVERLAAIRAAMLAARAEPALDLAGLAAPVLSRLPADVAILARGRVGAMADLSASNFPGLTEDVYIAGARVERFFAFGPLPGSAVMATLVSHRGVCCIALNCDGDAISEPDALVADLERAFDEVIAAGERGE